MLSETADGLFCPAGEFYIDPWNPVARALITHAHGDHARPGQRRLPVRRAGRRAAAAALRHRTRRIEPVPYGQPLDDRRRAASASIRPATCSARRRSASRAPDGVWVVAGDYKRAADPTCAPFEPVRCDTFITESTFGLPIYRWDSTASVIADIVRLVAGERRRGQVVGAVLLHDRQGAAHPRRARARTPIGRCSSTA